MLSPHRDASLNKRLQNKDCARIYRTTLHKLCLNQRKRQRDKEKEVKETEEVGVHHEKRKLLGHSCTKGGKFQRRNTTEDVRRKQTTRVLAGLI